jgi:zinc/manganese transport system substrate-binding protein
MAPLSRRLFLASAAALAWGGPVRAQAKLPVVASFSILADLVRQVGGDRVDVVALVGPDGDAHVFQPSPQDARKVASAALVVLNGLGLEGWMDRLVKASKATVPTVIATAGVRPRRSDEAGEGRDHEEIDPHAWQDIGNARIYVANIRDGLIKADPAGKDAYEANAARYLAALDVLDAEVRAALAKLPPERRRIITSHDAFGYFGDSYGIAFIAPQGVSTETEASAKDVARIIRQIRAETIPAVFLENVSDPRLAQRIAKETGARIGGRLYSDALSPPDGPAGTYIDMMRSNIRELTAALSG